MLEHSRLPGGGEVQRWCHHRPPSLWQSQSRGPGPQRPSLSQSLTGTRPTPYSAPPRHRHRHSMLLQHPTQGHPVGTVYRQCPAWSHSSLDLHSGAPGKTRPACQLSLTLRSKGSGGSSKTRSCFGTCKSWSKRRASWRPSLPRLLRRSDNGTSNSTAKWSTWHRPSSS